MQHTNRWMVLVLLIIAALQLSGCGRAESGAAGKIAPSKLEPIEGSDFKRVILTEKATQRLDVQMVPVREEQVVRKRTVGAEVVAQRGAGVASPSRVWVRVLLDESGLDEVDRSQPTRILPLDDEEDADDGMAGLTAEPDEGPGDDNPEEATGALYYAVSSAENGLAPGDRVLVELSLLGGETPRKIVPYAAVLYGVNGETWVYSSAEPLVYVRQPIVIDYIEDDLAILSEGPEAGTPVVTIGAAELFGAETGVSK
ncbi:MAG: hypothetical protein M5U01_32130 [Ardenticatenaceae bacterium]|nr:hypothetical protein [Ardenticatenaceae bacterium]